MKEEKILPPFSIFICYRRSDSDDVVDRVYQELINAYGSQAIFRDIDSIPPGVDFFENIQNRLRGSLVVLVFIGPEWIKCTDTEQRRRIHAPRDYVRFEIETALSDPEKRVIPTLIRGARLPPLEDLPVSIRSLRKRNDLKIRSAGADYQQDIRHLLKTVGQAVEDIHRERRKKERLEEKSRTQEKSFAMAVGEGRDWGFPPTLALARRIETLDPVNSFAFSHPTKDDSVYLIGATAKGRLSIWEAFEGRQIPKVMEEPAPIHAIACHPQKALLATVGREGVVRIWLANEPAPRVFPTAGVSLQTVAFHPSGEALATAGENGRLIVWAFLGEPRVLFSSAGGAPIQAVSYSTDGKLIAAGDREGRVRIWECGVTIKEIAGFSADKHAVNSLAFCGPHQRLVTGGEDGLPKLWELHRSYAAPARILKAHSKAIIAVAAHPSRDLLACASLDGCLQLGQFDEDQTSRIELREQLLAAAFSPDGRFLGYSTSDRALNYWRLGD